MAADARRALLARAAVVVPSITVAVFVIAEGSVTDPVLLGVLLTVAAVVGAVGAVRARRAAAPGERDTDLGWLVVAVLLAPLLAAAALVGALDVDHRVLAPTFALLVLGGCFLEPQVLRLPIAGWSVTCWLGVVVIAGERDPAVLLLHAGGGVILTVIALGISDALHRGLEQAASSRVAAERRAELLASLLRTHDLDPDTVLASVADGLLGLGFDLVAIREVDRQAAVLRLIEGAARDQVDLEAELPLHEALYAPVVAGGRPRTIDVSVDQTGTLARFGMRSMRLAPIRTDGSVVAVVLAAGRSPLNADTFDAMELLVAQAASAFEQAQRFRQDEQAVTELRRLDQRTQDLISTVSHELRTPLTVVQGLGATLAQRWEELPAARRDDLLDRVDANAERLGAMVRRLLDTSVAGSGALHVEREVVALAHVADAAIARLRDILMGHDVEVEVPPELQVVADPGLLEHVLENLLLNVARHTPKGTTAWVVAEPLGEQVRIEVRDDGPGIDDADLPHILDRFYRGGDEDHRVATSGLGLGLALVADVIDAHEGRLRVTNRPEGGTVFSFELPLPS